MAIRPYIEADRNSWLNLIENSDYARLSHELDYSKWISEIYGYTSVNLVVDGAQGVEAIFPTFVWKRWGKKPQLLSVPYFEYGGPIFRSDIDNSLNMEFIHGLLEFNRQNGYEAVRLMGTFKMHKDLIATQFVRRVKICDIGILKLSSPDTILRKTKYSVRKNIKKAKKSGLSVYEDHSIKTFHKAYYPLYLKTMHRFGTPPHPFSYYDALLKHLPSVTRLWTAYLKEVPVACLLGFSTGKATHIVSTVSLKEFWSLRPNDLLHWEAILSSFKEDKRIFDFGLMRYPGQNNFKEKWGVERFPYYEYIISGAKRNFKPIFQDVSSLSFLWRKFVPLSITEQLGKPIRRMFVR